MTSADSGQTFSINYDTNNITLTLVPEPSTYAFGAIGVLGALVLIRRRRTK
ncbi:MAG: PEP-CTERM sorting domain-containing protein [Puniceicoccales bacterium]|nr:PEP-CTERM sorting domain-containing protein [Puniceicoccales bacterium]